MAYVQGTAWTEQQKRDIVARLEQKGVRGACPMCATHSFTLLDGYFNHAVQMDLSGSIMLGGPSIPAIAIVCTNCGFMSQHAAGALGLLPGDSAGGR